MVMHSPYPHNYTNCTPYVSPHNIHPDGPMNSEYLKSPGMVRDDDFDVDNIGNYQDISGDCIIDKLKEKRGLQVSAASFSACEQRQQRPWLYR